MVTKSPAESSKSEQSSRNEQDQLLAASVKSDINYDTVSTSSYFSKQHITEEDKLQRTSSYLYSFINVIKGHVGITFIAIPYGFVEVGLVGAILGLTIVLVMNYYSVYLIIMARNKFKHLQIKTIGELSQACFGHMTKNGIDVLNIFLQLAACLVYEVYFGEFIDIIFCDILTVTECGSEIKYRFLFALMILPVVFVKEYRNVAYFSLACNIVTFLSFAFIIASEAMILNAGESTADDLVMFDWRLMGLYFGQAMCLYEGNGMILNFYSEVDSPRFYLPQMWVIMTIIFVLDIGMGILSYFTFGNNIQSLIIYNIPNTTLGICLKLFYMGAIMGIYVLVIMPVFHIMERQEWYGDIQTNPTLKRCTLRTLLVFSCAIASLIFSNITTALSFFGSVGGTIITFILPVLLYNKAYEKSKKKASRRKFNIVFLVLGTIFCSIAVVSSIIKIIIDLIQ